MNWYNTQKIDSLVMEYWSGNDIKTAGIKDWLSDFNDKPLMKGLWGVGKNAVGAIINTLMGIVYPIGDLLAGGGSDDTWETTKRFLSEAVKRIAKTIYSATKMGYGGVKLLKDIVSFIRNDLNKELEASVQKDMMPIYQEHLQELKAKKENKIPLPKWHTDDPEHFPQWFREKNKEIFNALNEVTENLAIKVDDFAGEYQQQLAA